MRRSPRKRLVTLVVAAAAAAAVATTATAEPAQITAKRAEAQEVLAQIQQIDADLGKAIEEYNGASVRLDQLEEQVEVNERHLSIARKAFRAAQQHLSDRVVALYTTGEQDLIEVLLGSASLDDLLDRVDSVRRISDQDIRIVNEVKTARTEIQKRAKKLAKARAEQKRLVAQRAEQKAAIESKLAERQSLYASIEGEIEQLLAEERERQRRLEEEARRRLEEEQRAAAAAEEAQATAASSPDPVPTPGASSNAPPSAYGSNIVSIAMQFLGVPYVWGGASPSGFDCSGLVMYAYAQIGISVPHYTGSLWNMGVPVSRENLQPGDLVFFNGLGHMGIYIGGGQMVHAPHTGDVVKVSDISSGWYASTYVGARRI